MIVLPLPDRDAEALGLASHHQGITIVNAYCQAATNLVD